MSSVLFEIKDTVAYITLNRPDKFNSFNREMALLMQEKLDECKSDCRERGMYITGCGKALSVPARISANWWVSRKLK
ncbi:MAG: enoyl-CoA hydratase-related protein [Chitinophagaceae bacterium]